MATKVLIASLRAYWRRYQLPAEVSPQSTRLAFAGLVGDTRSKGKVLSMGPILEIMDSLSGALTIRLTQGAIATVSFDRVDTIRPVLHGDVVRVEGQVINIGQSSMTVQCTAYRLDMEFSDFQQTHNAIMTMVAVDDLGRSLKGLPKLVDNKKPGYIQQMQTFVAKRQTYLMRLKQEQENVDRLPAASLSDIELHEEKPALFPVKSTELEFRQSFHPKSLNVTGIVFGGEILTWMENSALVCARKFTKNEHMFVVSVNQVIFRRPIYVIDVVTLRVRVCHVRASQLEVEVEIFSNSVMEKVVTKSHSGYFTIASFADDKTFCNCIDIPTGLAFDEQDQAEMRLLLKAQKRWSLEKEANAIFHLEALDITFPRPQERIESRL